MNINQVLLSLWHKFLIKTLVNHNLLAKRKAGVVLTKIFKRNIVKWTQTLHDPFPVNFVRLESTFEDTTLNILQSKWENIYSLFFGKVKCLLALGFYVLSCSSPLIQLIDLAFKTVNHNRDS